MDLQLRAYVLVDSMQPQAAAHVASTSQGDVPVAGMSELLIEVAPGNHIFRCTDIALKAANVRPAFQIVEREFGLLEIHSQTQTEVEAAGEAILEHLGLKVEDRIRPKIASTQMITNVTPYQAQLINKWRKGSLLLARSTLFILETAPAAYISLAGNEAEKAADISLIEVRAVGRFGRLFISGLESDVEAASKAAIAAIEAVGGRE